MSALLVACLDSPDGGGNDDLPPEQLLANPDFEENVTDGTFDGAVEIGTTEELGLPPSDDGPHVARLGGQDNQMDILVQDLAVPESVQRLELSGRRCYDTGEGFEQAYDTFTITIEPIDGGTNAEVLVDDSNLDATSGACEWLPFERETADYSGQQIRLVIEGRTDEGTPSSFAIDGLALTATH